MNQFLNVSILKMTGPDKGTKIKEMKAITKKHNLIKKIVCE